MSLRNARRYSEKEIRQLEDDLKYSRQKFDELVYETGNLSNLMGQYEKQLVITQNELEKQINSNSQLMEEKKRLSKLNDIQKERIDMMQREIDSWQSKAQLLEKKLHQDLFDREYRFEQLSKENECLSDRIFHLEKEAKEKDVTHRNEIMMLREEKNLLEKELEGKEADKNEVTNNEVLRQRSIVKDLENDLKYLKGKLEIAERNDELYAEYINRLEDEKKDLEKKMYEMENHNLYETKTQVYSIQNAQSSPSASLPVSQVSIGGPYSPHKLQEKISRMNYTIAHLESQLKKSYLRNQELRNKIAIANLSVRSLKNTSSKQALIEKLERLESELDIPNTKRVTMISLSQ